MNRIYQGKVTGVEIYVPGDKSNPWQPFDADPEQARGKWQAALWQHHELFQDAINYYTLALAALAEGLAPEQAKGPLAWRDQVRSAWVTAKRKAVGFSGPHLRLARLLGTDPLQADPGKAFDACAGALLKKSAAAPADRAKALLQLLEEANQSDLNQVCVSRLPWLCTAHGKLDATPKDVAQYQEARMLTMVREIHEAPAQQLAAAAAKLELGCFVTQTPKQQMTGAEARAEGERLFKSASDKAKALAGIATDFAKQLDSLGARMTLPRLGRKPKGAYPLAAVFKLLPCAETWEAFKLATANLYRRAVKTKASPAAEAADFIAEARTKADEPLFDYFTNQLLSRAPDNTDRAVWFDFDLAAFLEAIKAPHRYFQDASARERSAEVLRQQKQAMEGRGGQAEDEHQEDDAGTWTCGFEGDQRIALLRELVTDTLGYVAEAEDPGEEAERVEYTIQERTLRGFEEIKELWRKLAGKGQATQEKLLAVLADQQGKHREDFGSATLYRTLAQPNYHPIWRDPGTEKWHAPDPLKAWRAYKELCFELKDKERPIRFTPAHAEHSPRYFIIPKQGRFGSDHQPGCLAFTCGVVLCTEQGWEPRKVRITYSAPRLRRDELRRDGEEDLESVPWLQPMMKALGLPEADLQDFANCRVTLQPEAPDNIQLTFPVEVNPEKLVASLGNAGRWERQFNLHPEGDDFYSASLRWPHEKQPAKAPVPWHEQLDSFCCLATDLGQRDAGAFARLAANRGESFAKKPSRFIGETSGKKWRAALERSGLFRLPGEDATVWRAISSQDRENSQDSGEPFDFREELWGERGRPARAWEADETAELMRQLEVPPEDKELTLLPEDWRERLSFPEQNDKLLVAMRRYQSRIARLHRWCWFLQGDERQQRTAWDEIGTCEDTRLISAEQVALATRRNPRLREELESQLRARLQAVPGLLERITNRILPLRSRSWRWDRQPQAADQTPLHRLTQNGPSLDRKERPVWLRGQRGLSLERIEQVEELRRRCQSLNQSLRRTIGSKPLIRRAESVPDPCPDLLEKLDHLKEQRVNQTAHMILAEALGLRLAPPPANKRQLRRDRDQHGVYEKTLDGEGRWIGPVDFVIIEDLSRYRATQGRAPRENSRLMRWCHRAVRDKLKQLCEVFGLPVLETPAAYSSRFCSRSGVPGFRAEEVAPGFSKRGQWAWIASRKDSAGRPTVEAEQLQEVERQLSEAQQALERHWTESKRPGQCPQRTLLVPTSGGPLFVPVVERAHGTELKPAVAQADVNAAINLALRAIADPRLWSIHPRLRTQRDKKDGSLATREKRKFGEKNLPRLNVLQADKPIAGSAANPNFFADLADLHSVAKQLAEERGDLGWLATEWAEATLPGAGTVCLLHSKSFWGTVKAAQWKRISEINLARLATWRAKLDPMPD